MSNMIRAAVYAAVASSVQRMSDETEETGDRAPDEEKAHADGCRVVELFKSFCKIAGNAIVVNKSPLGQIAAALTRTVSSDTVLATVPLVCFDGMSIDFNRLITDVRATQTAEGCSFRGIELRIRPGEAGQAGGVLHTSLHAIVSGRAHPETGAKPGPRNTSAAPARSKPQKRGLRQMTDEEDVSDQHMAFARAVKAKNWCADSEQGLQSFMSAATSILLDNGFEPTNEHVWGLALDRMTAAVTLLLTLCRAVQVVTPLSGAPMDKIEAAAQHDADGTESGQEEDPDDMGGVRIGVDFEIRVPSHEETKAQYPPVIALVSRPVAPATGVTAPWTIVVPLDCTESLYSPVAGLSVLFSLSSNQWVCYVSLQASSSEHRSL